MNLLRWLAHFGYIYWLATDLFSPPSLHLIHSHCSLSFSPSLHPSIATHLSPVFHFSQALSMIKFLYLLCLVTVLSLSVLAHAHNRPLYHAPRMHRIPRGLNTRELSAHAHDGSSPLNKRITEEQAWQKASLDCWNDAFLKMNAKWQQAVQAGWEVDFNTFSTKNGGLPEPLKCTSGADCTASTKSSSSKSHGECARCGSI